MHFSLSNILSRPHLMFKRVNLLVEHKNQPNPWACRIIFQSYIAYNIFFLRPSGILLNPSYLSIVIQYHTVPTSNGHYNNNNIKDIPLHTQYLPSNERGTHAAVRTYVLLCLASTEHAHTRNHGAPLYKKDRPNDILYECRNVKLHNTNKRSLAAGTGIYLVLIICSTERFMRKSKS